MCDLINRQAAIEAVAELASSMSVCISVDECHGMKRMQGMVVRALDDLPSAEPEIRTETHACDLISRRAAIDLICEHGTNLERKGITTLAVVDHKQVTIDLLETLPSAQPEIIRCRDCDYWDESWQSDDRPNYHYCPLADGMRKGDFYCADAERRGK